MTKRRTKEEKISANYQFLLRLNQSVQSDKFSFTNNQLETIPNNQNKTKLVKKNIIESAKAYDIAYIRKDLVKSLILTSLILALEIVLYFVLN
jgi:hypothetical protein